MIASDLTSSSFLFDIARLLKDVDSGPVGVQVLLIRFNSLNSSIVHSTAVIPIHWFVHRF